MKRYWTIHIPDWDSLTIIGLIVIVIGLLAAYVYLWPKDSKGNPLPCTQYMTTYIPETIGNTVYMMPIQNCIAWASPKPT